MVYLIFCDDSQIRCIFGTYIFFLVVLQYARLLVHKIRPMLQYVVLPRLLHKGFHGLDAKRKYGELSS